MRLGFFTGGNFLSQQFPCRTGPMHRTGISALHGACGNPQVNARRHSRVVWQTYDRGVFLLSPPKIVGLCGALMGDDAGFLNDDWEEDFANHSAQVRAPQDLRHQRPDAELRVTHASAERCSEFVKRLVRRIVERYLFADGSQ
jgi:hypothetical protein